jgi:hypothetical protein
MAEPQEEYEDDGEVRGPSVTRADAASDPFIPRPHRGKRRLSESFVT